MHLFIFLSIVSTVLENVPYHINVLVLWAVEVTQMMIVIAVAHGGLEEAVMVMGAMLLHNGKQKKIRNKLKLCFLMLCSFNAHK